MNDLKEMLSSLYGLAAETKNFLFDTGLGDGVQLPVPVLSVGNLSVGGTGKTPVVQRILAMSQEKGLTTTVVSRNYKARSRGIQKVDLSHKDAAHFFGDEAFLLAQSFPAVDVWTGPRKYLTAQEAMRKSPSQLIVVDDGFQHRSLHRDFDLVLVDCTSSEEEDLLLPRGRLREGFESLWRASAVVLTKVNWADPKRVEQLRSRIPSKVEVCHLEFQQKFLKPIETQAPILVVSGIAKPRVFEANLKDFQVREHMVFPDHHVYTENDINQILQAFRLRECHQILTTEKDFVKLQMFPDLCELLNPVSISTQFREEPRGLHAFLDKCRQS